LAGSRGRGSYPKAKIRTAYHCDATVHSKSRKWLLPQNALGLGEFVIKILIGLPLAQKFIPPGKKCNPCVRYDLLPMFRALMQEASIQSGPP
jgi:hypothetical protein